MADDPATVPLRRVSCDPIGRPVRLSGAVPTLNSADFIGGQNLELIFDTGSADLWVAGPNCTSEGCTGVTKYDNTSTLLLTNHTFSLDYLVGSVNGVVGSETISLGPYEISPQAFALVDGTTGLNLSSVGNSGILGFSFPDAAVIPPTAGQTLLENVFSYLDDDHRFFAFHLGRDVLDSSLSLGQLDDTFSHGDGSFAYTHVYQGSQPAPDFWKLPLRSVSLNGSVIISAFTQSRVSGSPTPIAVLDTGTTFMLGPSVDVEELWKLVGGARKLGGLWQVKCNRAVKVGFTLGDGGAAIEYIVDPADISWKIDVEDEWCTGGIQESNDVNSGDWILGATFLRNVYVTCHGTTVTSPPRIGLLALTDPSEALARFQQDRGPDTLPPISTHASIAARSAFGHLAPGAICAIVLVVSFWFGGSAVWLAEAWKARKRTDGGSRKAWTGAPSRQP
ncbi:aspartic peptidase domain-containing protein [Gloeopeniophorella convolvens]|nr:aspartic peptidase domain-containing protein [Gloeopeniophorella convolvens]